MAELRRHPRIDARIEVNFQTGADYVQCYTKNISRGGLYIESENLPDPNAHIELNLSVGDASGDSPEESITVFGRVVRLMSESQDGHTIHKIGIQFVDISPQTQVHLDKLYQDLELKLR